MKAGSISSWPTVLWPTCSCACRTTPAKAAMRAGGDEGERDVGRGGDAGELGGARAVADDVEIAAERQVVEHDPQHECR